MKKRLFAIFFSFIYLFSLLPVNAKVDSNLTNEQDRNLEKLTASKISVKDVNRVGEYDIKITMPGDEEKISGYNFLFVMDASYSTDEEWMQMREAVLDTVNLLLSPNSADKDKEVTNRVALMTFGMGEHLIIPFTKEEKKFTNTLVEDIGGGLLYPGRSATNNEVGFTGAYKYIKKYATEMKSEGIEVTKDNTYVIYLSDGNSNLNEKEVNFYEVAKKSYASSQRTNLYDAYLKVEANKEEKVNEIITKYIDEIKELYLIETGQAVDKETLTLSTIKTAIGTKQSFIDLLNKQIDELYDEIGYDKEKGLYSASEYERLINYYPFSDNRTLQLYLENMFYMPIKSIGSDRIENSDRAISAGFKLSEIAHIYTIGFNLWRADAGKIMNPEFAGGTYNKQTFTPNYTLDDLGNKIINHFSEGYYSSTADTVKLYLKQVSDKIIYRNYKNTTIVDYTSKWVIPMDTNGDGVFNELDIVVKNAGSMVENPDLTVEKLTKEELEQLASLDNKDLAIINNTNNDIYRITFKVEDKLTSVDKYTITYRVKVDTQEDGYVSDYEYVANGKTTLTYDEYEFEYKNVTNNDGSSEIVVNENKIGSALTDIIVPTVRQAENIVIIKKTDENGNLLPGSDFSIISKEGMKQVKKYYSKDGITYTITNENNEATYFKFIGLYDFNYEIKEVKTPNTYHGLDENLGFNFTNLEGIIENKDIINERIYGEVVVHYVVKVGDEYISFDEYGCDEFGNVSPDFNDVKLENDILKGILGEKFTTTYREVKDYNFIGIYNGNILVNTNLEKLSGEVVEGWFIDGKIEYTYVYEVPMGSGEDIPDDEIKNEESAPEIEELPPQTGIQNGMNFSIISLISMFIIYKKKKMFN